MLLCSQAPVQITSEQGPSRRSLFTGGKKIPVDMTHKQGYCAPTLKHIIFAVV